MARKSKENPQLDMTPMIDVVFALIIFFVVTIQQEDIFTRLNANRPAPSTSSASSESDTTVTIEIGRGPDANGTLVYNKRVVNRSELNQNLREVARTSKKTPIVPKCASEAPHTALVDALDICCRNQLYSVSIFTL